MRYYLAGAYARRAELAEYADQMIGAGIRAQIMSSWLIDDQTGADAGFSVDGLRDEANVKLAWTYGQRDVADLIRSDAIVSFTGHGGRGGRHIEHGIAMAFQQEDAMRLVIVGPREHVFHCHPDTEVYADFAAFLKHEIDREEETKA